MQVAEAGGRCRRDEQGFAMIVSVTVGAIAVMLVMAMLASGSHLQSTTVRARKWTQALQVAEAGVERAVAHLAADDSYAGTGATTPESVAGGEFVTSVVTPKHGWRVITSTGWVPKKGATGAINRRLEVTYGPSKSFAFALFSFTNMYLNNTGEVIGDVFANESIDIDNGLLINGSVMSATGTVDVANNAEVRKVDGKPESGSVYSGGFHPTGRWGIRTSEQAVIERDARSQVEDCGVTSVGGLPVYNIENRGRVGGRTLAGGTVTYNAGVEGTDDGVCATRAPRRDLPPFRSDAYNGLATDYPSVASFVSAMAGGMALVGLHRVTASAEEQTAFLAGDDDAITIDTSGYTITGDFTLITTGRFAYSNATSSKPFYAGGEDANVSIIVLNDTQVPAAIDIENQLQLPDPGPALLFYAEEGLIDLKNNADGDGAVYAGKIAAKNNLDLTYDGRVERILGFGPERFERVSFRELTRERS